MFHEAHQRFCHSGLLLIKYNIKHVVILDLWFQCWFVEEGCLPGTSRYLICSDLRSSADQCVLSLHTWAEYLTVTFTIQMSPWLCNTQCRVRNGVLGVEYESKWRDAAWSCRDHGENSSGSLSYEDLIGTLELQEALRQEHDWQLTKELKAGWVKWVMQSRNCAHRQKE